MTMKTRTCVLVLSALLFTSLASAQTGAITGRVTDAVSGAPLAGIQVSAQSSSVVASTDGNGIYTLSGLAPGWYWLSSSNSAGYLNTDWSDRDAIPVLADRTTAGIDFTLAQPAHISGTVRNALTGAPVWGVNVSLQSVAPTGYYRSATTDMNGLYSVSLPAARYTVVASGSGVVSETVTVTVGIGQTLVHDFSLSPGGALAGRLTVAGGGTVSSPSINVYDAAGRRVGSTYITGANGAYSVTGLPAGTYYVRTSLWPAYVDQLYAGISCGDSNTGCPSPTAGSPVVVTAGVTTGGIDFSVSPLGGTISGTVTRAGGGLVTPLSGLEVIGYDAQGTQLGLWAIVGDNGAYSIRSVLPGTYRLRTAYAWPAYRDQLYQGIDCASDGTCPDATTGTLVTVPRGTALTGVNFALAPVVKGSIGGTVTGDGGAPVQGIDVTLYGPSSYTRSQTARTDVNGHYAFADVVPGRYRVASASIQAGYLPRVYGGVDCFQACSWPTLDAGTPVVVTAGATTSGIDLALKRGGTIRGTVRDARTGAGLSGVSVQVYRAGGTPVEFCSAVFSSVAPVITDASGTYTTPPLPAGVYRARAALNGYLAQLFAGRSCPGNLPCLIDEGTAVTVAVGQATTAVDFALESAAVISGRVLDATTGAPALSARVSAYCGGQWPTSADVDSAGRYALSLDVDRASCRLAVRGNFVSQAYPGVELSLGWNEVPTKGALVTATKGTTVSGIDFIVRRGGAIAGSVSYAGRDLYCSDDSGDSCYVEVLDAKANVVAYADVYNGYNTRYVVPPGDYYVRLRTRWGGEEMLDLVYPAIPCNKSGPCDLAGAVPVHVAAATTTRGIDFTLDQPGGQITGVVRDATTGAPLDGSGEVRLFDAAGRDAGSTSSWNGRYTFWALVAGSYFVVADGQPYGRGLCSTSAACPPTSGTAVRVDANAVTSGIDISVPGAGTISGTVTAVGTGLPVPSAAVVALRADGTVVATGGTGADGAFVLGCTPASSSCHSRVPVGTYYVRAAASEYATQLYGGVPCSHEVCAVDLGTPVTVTAGQDTTHIDFALAAGGRVAGLVTDAATAALLAGQSVTAYDSSGASITTVLTDSVGRYHIDELAAGTFYVAATGIGAYVNQVATNLPCPAMQCDVRSGGGVAVNAGGSTDGVDLALTRGGEISGAIAESGTGTLVPGARVSAWTVTGHRLLTVTADWLGVYVLSGLPAGTYFVDATSGAVNGVSHVYRNLVCPSLTCDVTRGTPIGVTAGATTGGIDITLGASGGSGGGGAVTTAPFGQIDTPAQDSAGIVGAIGVTGWALDDRGVASVKIYRSCLAFDDPASCQAMDDLALVYVGDAVFLAGARPDVEAAFPTYPNAGRAGWGYLLLTNTLPHVVAGLPQGGQGDLSLFAVASDVEGHRTLLGRSHLDHTPTRLSLANDTIAKPFGAIDTPGQGETVSGRVANFGWVLTPDADTTVDSSDILVPIDGSAIRVFVDGVAVGHVTYNQCRGHVGPVMPAGGYCDDDVANVFGNETPQPTFTPRSANATRYRNLDAGRAAIGSFDIDTTLLSNGLHTIAWGVTDSAGRTEGIGSRFFTVANAQADVTAAAGGANTDSSWRQASAGPPAASAGLAADGAAHGARVLRARTGFDLDSRFAFVQPGDEGIHRITLDELGRVELHLGAVETAFLEANGTRRALPVGSSLDAATGTFTWAPGAGFVGTYRLVFVRGGEESVVEITVRPRAAVRQSSADK
jgi:hypothetical protein